MISVINAIEHNDVASRLDLQLDNDLGLVIQAVDMMALGFLEYG